MHEALDIPIRYVPIAVCLFAVLCRMWPGGVFRFRILLTYD
jgi:hypothetical protein